jgi:hypothetical protein
MVAARRLLEDRDNPIRPVEGRVRTLVSDAAVRCCRLVVCRTFVVVGVGGSMFEIEEEED